MVNSIRGLVLVALACIAFCPIELSLAQDPPRPSLRGQGGVRVFRKSESPELFRNKAKFISNKRMLTKMAPFGPMDTICISMTPCSFAGIRSARPERGRAGPVASARTWHCAHS